MTREEEINEAIETYMNGLFEDGVEIPIEDYENIEDGFSAGAKWADGHPKSPWISVKDDLPCNHKELILSTKYHTVSVFTYKKGGACSIDSMIIRNGKWEWEAWKENYLYWMPIPNLPKE